MASPDALLKSELLRQVDQSVWANRQWTEFVYTSVGAEPRPRELLGHIMESERVWFDRIEGANTPRPWFPALPKEELLRNLEENGRTFRELIATRLGDVIPFRRASGEEYHARVLDVIHHLLTHGYHHRGQLAAHYARLGVSYPNTDHIKFLMEHGL